MIERIRRQKEIDEERESQKRIKSGLRICPGHDFNSFDNEGKCLKCGGWFKEGKTDLKRWVNRMKRKYEK